MNDRHVNTASYYEEEQHHHYGFVIIAIVVSVLLHYFLAKRVANMRFDVTADIDQSVREQYEIQPPVKIDNMPEDPLKPVENPFAGDPTDSPGVGIQSAVTQLASKPDAALSAPRISEQALSVAKAVPVKLPVPKPLAETWYPRQEILSVVEKVVRDDIAAMPRIEIPAIERISAAPDYLPPVNLTKDRFDAALKPTPPMFDIGDSAPAVLAPEEIKVTETPTPEAQTPEVTISRFGEKPSDISSFKPVDSRLVAKVQVLRSKAEPDRSYFRLEVAARDPAVLPVVPKDIVFVQDASRSLAEERLYFCRKALNEAIRLLPSTDRFNVASFRENVEFCFNGWASPNNGTIEQASSFINAMKSSGDTDLFESMKTILSLPRDSSRPLIIVLITDGKATKGLTKSSEIIGEFSKLNDNTSVFAVGTHGRANNYLLDLLTFCNRGDANINGADRWNIPQTISESVIGCSQPVLGRVGVTTDLASKADLFPLPSANLYANRTLEYYGSCPSDVTNLVVQVRGEGGQAKCDIIFQMDLANAEAGGEDIRIGWARRKMYSLIGQYAREPSQALLDAIRRHSAATGLPVPYRSEIMK